MLEPKLNVVITGGLGFIGSNLVNWLSQEDFNITIVDDFTVNEPADFCAKMCRLYDIVKKRPDVKIIKDRFQDYEFPEGTDFVIHLAAYAGVRRSMEHPDDYVNNNFIGTQLLLHKILKLKKVPKLINASSSSVYGDSDQKVFKETDTGLEPISPYASTKLAAEEVISSYCRMYDLSAISLRFFTVYGPGMRPDLAISKFTRAIDEGKTIELYGSGATVRDYTHIDDICNGIVDALVYMSVLSDKHEHQIYNLCSNRTISLNEMVKTIEKYVGKKAKVKHVDRVKGDVLKTFGSYDKAKADFGYEPKVRFVDGIRGYVNWYKTHKHFYKGGEK